MKTVKRSFGYFAIAALLLTSVPNVQAVEVCSTVKKAAGGLFLASLARFFYKHPNSLPDTFSYDALLDGDWEQLWKFLDEKIIGQQYKGQSLRSDGSSKVWAHPGASHKGLYGHLHSYSKAVGKALEAPGKVVLFAALLKAAESGEVNKENFCPSKLTLAVLRGFAEWVPFLGSVLPAEPAE